jgi:hypothetical protein
MVAPLDAKASFEVEGETITLRLNFRSIALAEEHGINLLSADGIDLSPTRAAIVVKCLAVQEHPDFTEDHTMAIVAAEPERLTEALIALFRSYGGKPGGNATGGKRKAPR